MAEPNDVVITGLGIVSPIGIGREAFEQSLRDRKSGVRRITRFDTTHLAVQIGAELQDFAPKLYVKPRKSLKVMSREIQTGVASATLAMEDASLSGDQLDTDRFGVVQFHFLRCAAGFGGDFSLDARRRARLGI